MSLACVVKRPQDPQLIQAVGNVVIRGPVHEVKLLDPLHIERLEQQHHIAQVGPLDLWHSRLQHLIAEGLLREQPPAGAWACKQWALM